MTKKEQAKVDADLAHYRLMAALRWTAPVDPDIAIPEIIGTYTVGFLAAHRYDSFHFGAFAWSEYGAHGTGNHPGRTNRSATRGGIELYSTRLLALKASRYLAERECAATLLRIDKEIELQIASDKASV